MKPFHKLLTGCALATSLASCQAGFELNSENIDQVSETSGTFIGPGNDASWELSIFDDDTFELEKTNSTGVLEYTASGDVDELSSGFFQLDITDDDDGAAGNVSGDITLFRVSDTLLFVLPIESGDDDIVIMITEDDCPATSINGNFVGADLSNISLSSESSTVVGTFEYSVSDMQGSFESIFAIDEDEQDYSFVEVDADTATETTITTSGDCNDGEGIISANGQNMYLSNNDNAIFYTSDSNRYLVVEESSVDSLNDFDGDYIGLMVNGSNEDPEEVFVTCENGTCTINERAADTTDVDEANNVYTLTLTDLNEPASGFIGGIITSLNDPNDVGGITCNYNDPSSSVFLACTGQSPEADQEQFLLYIVTD